MEYELTILMPCLNEERSIAFCVNEAMDYIRRSGVSAEVLVADNGSSDGSVQTAERCGARVVHISKKGYGNALLGGIKVAKGKYIIMGDSDGSYDFSDLDKFMVRLRKGYALVMGNRLAGGIEKGAMPLSHRIGVPILSLMGRIRYGTRVGDFHCGLRGFDRMGALSLGLKCGGMEFATEMIGRFAKSGAKIAEVPVVLRKDRRCGRSHLRSIRDGLRHLRLMLSPLK